MPPPDVRVASIGLGWWGGQLARAAASTGRIEVSAAFARDSRAREVFCREHGGRPATSLTEIWEDPGIAAVLLATPHSTHLDLIRAAAAAGKHIFVEKPLALTVAEAREAMSVTSRAGVVLQVGHNKRRQPANREIKRRVGDGTLGMVHLVTGLTTKPKDQVPRPGWRSDPHESPVGGMTGLGIHMVDTMQYLLGPVTAVQVISRRLWRASELDDVTTVSLEFRSGPLGQLATSLVLPSRSALMVMGTSGAMWNEDDGTRLFAQSAGQESRQQVDVAVVDTIRDELTEFADCVLGTGEPETGGREAVAAVAVLEAIRDSAGTGALTPVPVWEP